MTIALKYLEPGFVERFVYIRYSYVTIETSRQALSSRCFQCCRSVISSQSVTKQNMARYTFFITPMNPERIHRFQTGLRLCYRASPHVQSNPIKVRTIRVLFILKYLLLYCFIYLFINSVTYCLKLCATLQTIF